LERNSPTVPLCVLPRLTTLERSHASWKLVINATEYRNVSLSLLSESKTNPRRIFEDDALKELAESIRTQGVLSRLLVRPLIERYWTRFMRDSFGVSHSSSYRFSLQLKMIALVHAAR
jgi:hypothetical protein